MIRNTWNNDFWNKTQTKAIQGICAVGIIFHHLSQKTCAPWLPDEVIVHGLEPFLNLGYLFVGVFFFCSGFGLYKNIKSNSNYLQGFIRKHFRPIILLYIITNLLFMITGQVLSNYTWFIYAILYLYLAFFISYKITKNDKKAISFISLFIIFYILICDFFSFGTWCYNTIVIFLAGIFFAKYTEQIVNFIRKYYLACLISVLCLLIISFFGAEKLNSFARNTEVAYIFNFFRITTIISQSISALSFSVLLFIVNQKISFQNKVLVFIGSMSLELYLIHVLFVEIFGYCFVSPQIGEICYIKNLFLYIVVVLILSFICAFGLSFVKKGADFLVTKYSNLFAVIRKDSKKCFFGLLILLAGVTVLLMITNFAKSSQINKTIESYKQENITFIPFENKNIAVHIAGDGDKSILIMRGNYDPCPTVSQKVLADELAKNYKVILVDFLGSGFSDNFESERTSENICKEIHAVAKALNLQDYILFAEGISGIHAQYYVNAYQDEVSSVVVLDTEFTKLGKAALKAQNTSILEYERRYQNWAKRSFVTSRLIDILGYKTLLWPIYQTAFAKKIDTKYDDVAFSMFFKNRNNRSITKERCTELENYLTTENLKYPDNIQILEFISENRRKDYEKLDINVNELFDEICVNKENHKTIVLVDCFYCITNNPEAILKNIVENLN